jgi:hypothetical protein
MFASALRANGLGDGKHIEVRFTLSLTAAHPEQRFVYFRRARVARPSLMLASSFCSVFLQRACLFTNCENVAYRRAHAYVLAHSCKCE